MSYDVRPIAELRSRTKFAGVTERFMHDEPGLVVKGFEMDGEFRTEAHSHPEIQLMIITEGELNMEVDGVSVAVPTGSVLTIAGDSAHCAWSPGGRVRGLDVIFRPASDGVDAQSG
jgi:quercetin dioxygenase-like cupin family protein